MKKNRKRRKKIRIEENQGKEERVIAHACNLENKT